MQPRKECLGPNCLVDMTTKVNTEKGSCHMLLWKSKVLVSNWICKGCWRLCAFGNAYAAKTQHTGLIGIHLNHSFGFPKDCTSVSFWLSGITEPKSKSKEQPKLQNLISVQDWIWEFATEMILLWILVKAKNLCKNCTWWFGWQQSEETR